MQIFYTKGGGSSETLVPHLPTEQHHTPDANCVKSEFLTAVTIKSSIFWHVMPGPVVDCYQSYKCFRGTSASMFRDKLRVEKILQT
jgi:hypothetical protein